MQKQAIILFSAGVVQYRFDVFESTQQTVKS